MDYPTLKQVNEADHEQICRWYRFLPSPGMNSAGMRTFDADMVRESDVMNAIAKRYTDGGGFNPTLSKKIGWDKP